MWCRGLARLHFHLVKHTPKAALSAPATPGKHKPTCLKHGGDVHSRLAAFTVRSQAPEECWEEAGVQVQQISKHLTVLGKLLGGGQCTERSWRGEWMACLKGVRQSLEIMVGGILLAPTPITNGTSSVVPCTDTGQGEGK